MAALTVVALAVAACGGDDDATEPTVTQSDTADTGASGAPPTSPAAVTADAQDSDGTSILVASVELPAPGFIAIHGDGGGSPGPVIGHSDLLPEGRSRDVVVTLDEPLTADTTVYPMAHIDIDDDGVYEFGPDDSTDVPALTADGEVAVVPAEITVTGASDGGAEPSGETAEITIADFAFSGATEIPVGTTVVVTNTDTTMHTWSADDDAFDSGGIAPGESFEFTFTEAGEFAYHCNFHPSMTGTIVVTG